MNSNIKIENFENNFFNEFKNNEDILILPQNWDSTDKEKFRFSENALTVKKLIASNNIKVNIYEYSENSFIINNRHVDWIAPIIFFSYSALSQNEHLISITLNIISNYLTDIFKGLKSKNSVTIELYKEEKNGKIKKAKYEGPISGLDKFNKSMKGFGI